MARYIIERNMKPESPEQLAEVGQIIGAGLRGNGKASSGCEVMSPRQKVKSIVSMKRPIPMRFMNTAARVGIPVNKISEVAMEIDPSMFH